MSIAPQFARRSLHCVEPAQLWVWPKPPTCPFPRSARTPELLTLRKSIPDWCAVLSSALCERHCAGAHGNMIIAATPAVDENGRPPSSPLLVGTGGRRGEDRLDIWTTCAGSTLCFDRSWPSQSALARGAYPQLAHVALQRRVAAAVMRAACVPEERSPDVPTRI